MYPKRRALFETLDANSKTYKDIMGKLRSCFESDDNSQFTLMENINLRMICPEDEFRSKICQLVYEQMLAVFDFNEDPVKLHSFIKTASWQVPVAVKAFDSINIVNTICSIASFYGVGLEVIRTDQLNPILTDKNYQANQIINSNFIDDPHVHQKKPKRPKAIPLKNQPIILDSKQPQSFSMKYKPTEDEDFKTQGVDAALKVIEK